MIWKVPEELREEKLDSFQQQPYASGGYMSKAGYIVHGEYND